MKVILPLRYFLLGLITVMPAMALAAAGTEQEDAQIVHLLNRITFGPTADDIATVRQEGSDAYIEQQLHPQNITLPVELQDRLKELTTANASVAELAERLQPPTDEGKLSPEEKKEVGKRLETVVFELSEGKILLAITSPAQLQEVMTDFWFNHFNVFFGKGLDRVLIASYERDAIRPYALGRFRDLLEATARHPAMLFYLDNWQNTDPNSLLARKAMMRGKELGINENYAREIMELHTLGVNGGYTQQDVTTLAHILTGWGIGRGKDWVEKSMFVFDPQRHDYNNQFFMGRTVRGGGMEEIDDVLNRLAANPATARHISYELAQYFVADEPPDSLVEKLTQTYMGSGGDISSMLRVLFHSSEFWDPQYAQKKFKPPFRYVVSALRSSDVMPEGDTRMLQSAIASMGEPLYRCQTPNGYSNTNDQWLNSDSLLKRITIAKGLAHFFNDQSADTIYASLGRNWSQTTLSAVQSAAPGMKPALLLSSPEFLYY